MNEKLVLIIAASAILNLTLLSIFSWAKSKNKPANFWLGFMFFAACAAILDNTFIFDHKGNIFLYPLGLAANLSFGALMISIVDSFLHPERKTIFFNWKLFIPTYLYLPFLILCIVQPHWSTDTIRMSEACEMTIFGTFYNLIIVGYSIGANVYLLAKHRPTKRKPDSDRNRTKRINEFLWIMLILQSFAFIPFLLKLDIQYVILYMPIFGQIFFIYVFMRMSFSMNLFENLAKNQIVAENTVKYSTIKLNEDKAENICQRIIELMEKEKSYLKMDYTLTDMSKELKVLPNLLSMVINSKLNCSFPDYINKLRVKNALELLDKASKNNLTIEAIAYDSGFNNRTSFYKAFKKHTGKLPGEYLRKVEQIKEVV